MSSSIVPQPSKNPVIESPNPQALFWDGFQQFCQCAADNDYLNAGELAALSPHEMRGWNAAILAADAAEYDAYRANRNSFDDLGEY